MENMKNVLYFSGTDKEVKNMLKTIQCDNNGVNPHYGIGTIDPYKILPNGKFDEFEFRSCYSFEEGNDFIVFRTTGNAPVELFEELSRQYPKMSFTHHWAEGRVGSKNCGIREYSRGYMTNESTPDTDKDRIAFAANLWYDSHYRDVDDKDDTPWKQYLFHLYEWIFEHDDEYYGEGDVPPSFEAYNALANRAFPSSTVFTGMKDEDSCPIFLGDMVKYDDGNDCVFAGEIVFEHGAYGIACTKTIPLSLSCGCHCDNFVSLWELYWNDENAEDDVLSFVKVIGTLRAEINANESKL